MRVFVSYSHQQGPWVWDRLVPVLKAGGAEVLIDKERFQIGKAMVGQMDALQAQADRHLLIFSPDYLASAYCQHEMKQAVALDPSFSQGFIAPVMREACSLPQPFFKYKPLYADLQDDSKAEVWDKLLLLCDATGLGARATDWLAARDEIRKYLERNQSVNLVVIGDGVNWRGLLEHLAADYLPDLAQVDFQNPSTTSRAGLLAEIRTAIGSKTPIPSMPNDLAAFVKLFNTRSSPIRLCLSHFDLVSHRSYYDVNLFSTLRYLCMGTGQLVLLVQSRIPFEALIQQDHVLSGIDIKMVELHGR